MRFSSIIAAALPALATAQDAGFADQYVAKFQNFLGTLGSKTHFGVHDAAAALEAKLGSMKLHTLTKENWKETLYEPVPENAVKPVEWWLLVSGRNISCSNRCERMDAAFNETAAKFAVQPGAPYMAYLNCDDQPLLCSSWAVGASHLWSIDMLPGFGAEIDIYKRRLNVSTVTSDDLLALNVADKENDPRWTKLDSYFHPFNGKATELGLGMPFAYILWFFNLFPSWAMMVIVSFVSRSMMSRRMQNMQ